MRHIEEADKLTGSQLLALTELLAGSTVSAAARAAEVHRGTVHRWMRDDPDFQAAWNAGRAEQFESARQQVLAMTRKALAVIDAALDNGESSTALAILKGTGVLCPPTIGPTTSVDAQRALNEIASAEREDDYLRSIFPSSLT